MTMTARSSHAIRLACCVAVTLLSPAWAAAQSEFTHAHLRVPEAQRTEAAAWYHRVLGGTPGELGPGPGIRHHNGFIGTFPNEGLAGDSGLSVLDHVGIGVADVAATVELARSMGATIRTEPQQGITAPVIAHITDPWGGRFELLQDDIYTGVNHVHLYASDADATRDWLVEVFGGEVDEARGQGRFHAIRYDTVWFLVSQAPEGQQRQPSRYRAIDHIGFLVPSLDEFRATLIASGYEPYLERPNPPGGDLLFFEGPDGLHVEMTQPAR
jgi:catechol 2,3-dioxygenase-like lactoylglutathione lyase family enzyme